MLPVLHWLTGIGAGESVRGTALAAARAGRMRNKKVKIVATRANMFNEVVGALEVLVASNAATRFNLLIAASLAY